LSDSDRETKRGGKSRNRVPASALPGLYKKKLPVPDFDLEDFGDIEFDDIGGPARSRILSTGEREKITTKAGQKEGLGNGPKKKQKRKRAEKVAVTAGSGGVAAAGRAASAPLLGAAAVQSAGPGLGPAAAPPMRIPSHTAANAGRDVSMQPNAGSSRDKEVAGLAGHNASVGSSEAGKQELQGKRWKSLPGRLRKKLAKQRSSEQAA
jgi:hypothetical protein